MRDGAHQAASDGAHQAASDGAHQAASDGAHQAASDGAHQAAGKAARIDAASYDLHAAAGHLLRRSQQRAVDLFVEEVGEHGPTPRQFAVLLSVHQNPGINQTDLVRMTGIDRSTLTELLRRLGRRGLVRRERQPEDRRTNALHLTAGGRGAMKAAIDAVERAQKRILEPIPAAERPAAMRVLERLAGLGG